MVQAAVRADPRFEASSIELDRAPPSYTVDTLRTLRELLGPDAELYLIVGADQALRFHAWREPEVVAELATLVVMDRAGESLESVLGGVGRAVRVPVTRIDVSSTGVRSAATDGRPLGDLVPAGVAEVVEREALYRR